MSANNDRLCHVICQSHIDMAWLWRWQDTIGFIRDTFQGEVDLFEEHPDYTFCQSQLIAYMVTQERFPELFEKIRELVKAGRWEIVGGELVESDHLIPCGESLVRQHLYAQLYARREFGTEAKVGWSPDSFGHSGNLPQIMLKSGIENLVYKRPLVGEQPVPRTPFWWRGIDGTQVLAYRTTNKGWDFLNPVSETLQKKHNLRHIWGYSGTGDRGGVRPYKELGEDEHGKHIYSTPSRYFEAVRAETCDLPVYQGELSYCYEGCYTTHADVKIANRECENLLYLAESLASAAFLEGKPYPHEALTQAWHKLAFHQFHDILPGTSIPEVYEDTHKEYDEIRRLAAEVVNDAAGVFVDADAKDCISVYNPLAHPRSALVAFTDVDATAAEDTVTGEVYPIKRSEQNSSFYAKEIPPCSLRTFKLTNKQVPASDHPDEFVLDNGILSITIDPETGWISSVMDLRCDRGVLSSPGGNVLTLWKEDSFENKSAEEWNAWDIGLSANSEKAELTAPPEWIGSEYGYPAIKTIHKWGSSAFTSTISLLPGADWVDIRLDCDWQETLVMLRTEFSINVSDEAQAWHEIPYGAVRRDQNGAETPSQRWVDISDTLYGAALVNDSRHAHSVSGKAIRMTLLRCATNPDPVSDRGEFTFRYRLCPHEKSWREARVVEKAYELNTPVAVVRGKAARDARIPSIEGNGIQMGACKVSEDGTALVLRLYESQGEASSAQISVDDKISRAWETNLLEDAQRELGIENGSINLDFTPYEIKTILLK